MVKSGLEKIFLNCLHALTMSFLLLNWYQACFKGGGQGGHMPPRFWQIRRRRRAAAARRITTRPPRFLDFGTCLYFGYTSGILRVYFGYTGSNVTHFCRSFLFLSSILNNFNHCELWDQSTFNFVL